MSQFVTLICDVDVTIICFIFFMRCFSQNIGVFRVLKIRGVNYLSLIQCDAVCV